MFILKGDKVVCFDTVLEVLILKGVRGLDFTFLRVDSKCVSDDGVSEKSGRAEDPPLQRAGLKPAATRRLLQTRESAARFRGNQDVPVGGGAKAGWHRRGNGRRWCR